MNYLLTMAAELVIVGLALTGIVLGLMVIAPYG